MSEDDVPDSFHVWTRSRPGSDGDDGDDADEGTDADERTDGETEPRYRYWFDHRDIPIDHEPDWATRHAPPEFWSEHVKFNVWHIEPGEGSFLNHHHEPVREYYYVAEGTLDIRLADDRGHDEVIRATAGTTVYLPGRVKHRPVNNSDEPAVLVVASGPPVSPEHVESFEDEEIL
jgi:mannose-6-phosphate isomerase-like protein (cupin superfamily)